MILTAAGSWVLMAYSFALRYFCLHAAGESITFVFNALVIAMIVSLMTGFISQT